MSDSFNLKNSRPSNPFKVSSRSSIKSSVESLINGKPNWLVYVRCDHRYPTISGFDPTTNSPNNIDQASFGLGYKVQFEKHKVRKFIRARTDFGPMTSPGYLDEFQTIIYSPVEYYPQDRDLYLECEWSTNLENIELYGKPLKIIEAYQISKKAAYSEDEVSFFASTCIPYNFSIDILNEWLLELGSCWVPKVRD